MTTFYSKERAKYGNLTGQVIMWPIEYTGDPDAILNKRNLPAGYLKCDGTKYYADEYPQLAAICGVGNACKFIRRNIDGTPFDTLQDNQFMVPDLGSKYPEPTSGANAGVYNNIRLDNALGNEVSRSGIGIEAVSAIGTNVRIDYSGTISVPSQEIDVRGKPSWSYAGATHRTDNEGVEENTIHPHTHFHSAVRARNMTTNETSSQAPSVMGQTGRRNASTIAIQDWLDATVNSTNIPGSGQMPCLGKSQWRSGLGATNQIGLNETVYYGGCLVTDTNTMSWSCIMNVDWTDATRGPNGESLNRQNLGGSADNSNIAKFRNSYQFFGIGCFSPGSGATIQAPSYINTPKTYYQGAPGVPNDFAGNSLYDVLPLQSEDSINENRAIPDIDQVSTETEEFTRESDPTVHNHRIDIDKGDHNYQVKTAAIAIPPDNLSTTMTIGEDSSVSIDSACQPFIIMEFLIKI